MQFILIITNILSLVFLIFITFLVFIDRKSSKERIDGLLQKSLDEQKGVLKQEISSFSREQFDKFISMKDSLENTLKSNRDETTKLTGNLSNNFINMKDSLEITLKANREETINLIENLKTTVDNKFLSMQQSNQENIDKVNTTLESKIKSLQESNEKRLEQIQGIVDEKLQKTLNTRISESFETVTKQLESVQKGLGEMKNIAEDARSLKNIFSNVKNRGIFGEFQLENMLFDMFSHSQYDSNVEISKGKRVDFVIKLPGKSEEPLLLPIDSKFPIEDYNRLLEAKDKTELDSLKKAFEQKIKSFAKEITSYILPPKTTDFALMFLPTEGLYAEIIQNTSLFEELRTKYKISPVGPNTLYAFLGSLQMGFKTLAIEKRSEEVWNVLKEAKKAFESFEVELEKAQKQLNTVDKTITDIVGARTKAINRSLKSLEDYDSTSALTTNE